MSDSFVTPWTVTHKAPLSKEFYRQEYLSGLPFPFPGDWTQGLNLGLPQCRQMLYSLSHQGSLTYQCVSAPTSDVRSTLELPFTKEVDLKPMKLESQTKLSPEPIRPHPTVTTHLQFQFPTQEAIVLLMQQE